LPCTQHKTVSLLLPEDPSHRIPDDDGKLSLEEFQSYFADEYFSPHLGEYLNVLSALEKLNVAILKAMDKTKEEYQGSSVLGQFVTRFLLRETNTQLQSLQSSLDCAMEAVWRLARPLQDLNVLLLEPLLYCLGRVFWVIVILEYPSPTHFQCPG
uniref:N-terminal EF-hand calcium binding protein 3 n=1 Tax=Hucho hucho TaxID=62062 RepID=A0A4W5JQD6_9TELE